MSLNQNFAIGLAIWGYKNWVGDLFPAKTRAQNFLNCYAKRFSIVEGNTTFYSIPSPETVDRWRLETEPGFQFFPKFPKTITHQGRLMPYLPQAFQFLSLMQGLGDRLGGLFLQLPPSYGPANFADLDLFLSSWRSATQVPLFLEVRHLLWFDSRNAARLNQRLTKHRIDRVLLDTRPVYNVGVNVKTNADDNPQQYSVNKKPNVPVQPIVTANTAFVRYISHPVRDRNTEYLNEWVEQVRVWLNNGKTVYFFVHCPLEEHSPQNARYFQELLERSFVPVPPLPWNTLPSDELTQLGLFET